jgi:hypothetical protein
MNDVAVGSGPHRRVVAGVDGTPAGRIVARGEPGEVLVRRNADPSPE